MLSIGLRDSLAGGCPMDALVIHWEHKNMYEFKDRVRYSETDETGRLRLSALVNYLQDCSTFHSTDAGLTVERLTEEKRAWLLAYWDIYVDRIPALCENIVVGTSPYEVKGVMARRNFWIREPEGEYLVRADSIWFCYDTARQRPVKITEEMIQPFGERRNVLALPESSRKIGLPEEMCIGEPVLVAPHHIDSNHHVNNAQYIAIAADVLAKYKAEQQTFDIHRIRVEYSKAAVLGNTMIPHIGKTEGGHCVSLRNEEGEVYCNVEIG